MKLAAALLLALAAHAETVDRLLEQKLIREIERIDAGLDGVLGVSIIDLTTGRAINHHADASFPTASSIKVPVMIQLFKTMRAGTLKMDQPLIVTRQDMVAESPVAQAALDRGGATTLREMLTAMIEVSDNTATNILIRIAGIPNVNATLDSLGLPSIRLRRKMIDIAAAIRNEENTASPAEMAKLMAMLYHGKVIGADESRQMLEILALVKNEMRAAVPPATRVASKPGLLDGVRCESGVVFVEKRPFAISVMTAYLGDERNVVGEVTAAAHEYFAKLARANRYGRYVQ